MLITRWTCENLLKLSGWTVDKTNPPISNCVLIAAPHTSNWDFILMLLFAGAPANKSIRIKSQFDVCGAAINTQFEIGGLVLSTVHPDNLSKFSQVHLVISMHYPSTAR